MYCTDAELARLIPARTLIELTSDDPLALVPDTTVMAEAREFAQSQCDARLRQRYTLPLASAPVELKHWSLALARWWLYTRRPDGPECPPAVLESKKDALDSLHAVRDAKMSLDVEQPNAADVPQESGRLRVRAPDPTFSPELWTRYG